MTLSLSLSPALYLASRVSVIRGSIALQDGSPLVGVNITFPQHPEYGYTISRQDGRYGDKDAACQLVSSQVALIDFCFVSYFQLRLGDSGRHVLDVDVPTTAFSSTNTHHLDTLQQLSRHGSRDHVQGRNSTSKM